MLECPGQNYDQYRDPGTSGERLKPRQYVGLGGFFGCS